MYIENVTKLILEKLVKNIPENRYFDCVVSPTEAFRPIFSHVLSILLRKKSINFIPIVKLELHLTPTNFVLQYSILVS